MGAVFTAIIQSSAAAVGILQALALTGTLSFSAAYPIILGIAIGGALPVLLGALGANTNGVRTAVAHLIIDVFGALFCGIVFYAINAVHPFSFMDAAISIVGVAAINTIFRLVTVVALAPFIGVLERFVNLLVGSRQEPDAPVEEHPGPQLEDRFIQYPALAFEQSREAIDAMAGYAKDNLMDAMALLSHYSDEGYHHVDELESLVDHYEDTLGSYLLRITATELTTDQNEDLHEFLHAITDFERISDHALNIADCAREIHEKSIEFSQATEHELSVLQGAVTEIVDLTVRAFVDDDLDLALRVEPLEELIDGLCDEMKNHHIDRLQKGICTLQHGFVFNDLLTNYERIGDHCSNVAVAMIELAHDVFDTHEYLESLKNIKDVVFEDAFEEYKSKYTLD